MLPASASTCETSRLGTQPSCGQRREGMDRWEDTGGQGEGTGGEDAGGRGEGQVGTQTRDGRGDKGPGGRRGRGEGRGGRHTSVGCCTNLASFLNVVNLIDC